MRFTRTFVVLLAVSVASACSRDAAPRVASGPMEMGEDADTTATYFPTNPSTTRLPDTVTIMSDQDENFGIDLAALTPAQASIVMSAWTNYGAILSGGRPDCAQAPFAPSDGGTTNYFCDGYDIARVHRLAGNVDSHGYDYGPSLNLLNGQRVERVTFYTAAEMAERDRLAD